MTASEWQHVVSLYKTVMEEELGEEFPQDPQVQLWGAVGAVFSSWMSARAVTYRHLHNIPEGWGTAVNIQAMVFGNLGNSSATGVAFTRNPSTGEKSLYGEFLVNAQGEDVVAGIRTPQSITEEARIGSGSDRPSMEKLMPEAFKEFSPSATGSKRTIATCRISSSPSSAARSGCCRPAPASARPARR
jgi:pyruvate,orthophosphate dikinase